MTITAKDAQIIIEAVRKFVQPVIDELCDREQALSDRVRAIEQRLGIETQKAARTTTDDSFDIDRFAKDLARELDQ